MADKYTKREQEKDRLARSDILLVVMRGNGGEALMCDASGKLLRARITR